MLVLFLTKLLQGLFTNSRQWICAEHRCNLDNDSVLGFTTYEVKIHAEGTYYNSFHFVLQKFEGKITMLSNIFKFQVWRVIKSDNGPAFGCKPHSVSADLGEEICVESSVMQEAEFERMSYRLVDCETGSFNGGFDSI